MSEEPPDEGFSGFPVLFFHEDPEEKRLRIEGAQPPPESIRVPRLIEAGQPEPDALEYPLLPFPWEPWSQGTATQSLARRYADWLNEIGPGRAAAFRALLERAGAPVSAGEPSPDLAALGTWLQDWFVVVAEPYVAQGFIRRERASRLGRAWVARAPGMQDYSRSVDALIGSLAHDLAFIVAGAARAERPGLAWQPVFDSEHWQQFMVTIDAGEDFRLIEALVEFLVQSVARPRGSQGRALRQWFGLTLRRCADRAVHGPPLAGLYEAFPEFHADLSYRRLGISRPSRSDPPAPAALVDAVETMRRAGWFDSVKFSDADVARAAQAAWRRLEHEDIPSGQLQMYWRLLLLDGGRTWSEDVEADVRPGDAIHLAVAESLSHLGLKGVRTLYDSPEDWTSRPGDLLLTLRGPGGKSQIHVPSPGQCISAALFTGLNALLPADGRRLWFFDHGPPVGIVTRATHAERDALEALTGLRLDRDPPAWWAALAPVPEAGTRADAAGTGRPPAGRPARQRDSHGRGPARAGGRASTRASPGRAAKGRGATGSSAGLPTAQQAFSDLMRDIVAPALRELGFKGSPSRGFTIVSGEYSGGFWTQKSRHSTSDEVMFWVHLGAADYWYMQLHALIPGNSSFHHWTLRAGKPVEPVGRHLLEVFRKYGWPAMLAAMDSPGYPPDPAVQWPRSFPPQPSPAIAGASGPNLGPLASVLRRVGRAGYDELFAGLADDSEMVRMEMAAEIGARALRDPRAVPALLNRLEFDPAHTVRESAALSLARVGRRAEISEALRAAAAEDEDVQVRWAARYALRLAAGP